jgi:parvulin-like peptidyl-prolyl isomerase
MMLPHFSAMNLALQIGDSQIPCDRVLQQLYDAQLLPQLLREMVIDELIDQVAGAYQIDLTPTPAEFEKLSTQVAGITPFQGMNETQIEAITRRTLNLHKFKQAGWGHKVSSYYQTIQHHLYRVSYSILQVEDGSLAQELFFRIQSGEQSFAELAVQYSQADSAKRGGTIGPILSREIPTELGQILQKLSPGELSPLFRLDNCYGFIRLNDVIAPKLDENMHQVLLDELFESWIQEQISIEVGGNGEISIAPTTTLVEQPPTLPVAEIEQIDRNSSLVNSQPLADLFAPDFAYREPDLTEVSPPQIQPSDTPDVTVVTEPEVKDLEVNSGFFFPNQQQDSALRESNSTTTTTPRATDSEHPNPFILPPDPETITPPLVQTQRRSRKLAIGFVMLIAPAILIMGIDRFAKSYNPIQYLPEPIRTWFKGS